LNRRKKQKKIQFFIWNIKTNELLVYNISKSQYQIIQEKNKDLNKTQKEKIEKKKKTFKIDWLLVIFLGVELLKVKYVFGVVIIFVI